MAVKGITIDTLSSASPHIYAYDQAIINNALTGGDAVHEMFDNLLATKVSNNIVTISPGVFSIQGHFANVVHGTTEPMTIENGTAGKKRNDLICAKFKRTVDTDEISLVVVKGTNQAITPVDPTIVQQNLLTGGTERLVALWRVSLDGINITTLTQLFTVQKNLNAFKNSLAPVTSGAFTKQDINGFRTVTFVFSGTCYAPIHADGVFTSNAFLFQLPPEFRFSSGENVSVSVVCASVVDIDIISYVRSTGTINVRYVAHADVGTPPATINFLFTGRI